jgi:hypothetical protein
MSWTLCETQPVVELEMKIGIIPRIVDMILELRYMRFVCYYLLCLVVSTSGSGHGRWCGGRRSSLFGLLLGFNFRHNNIQIRLRH